MTDLYIDKLSAKTIDSLNSLLDSAYENNQSTDIKNTCTVNGWQSINLVGHLDQDCLGEIYQKGKIYIDQYYKNNLEYYHFYIDHMHFVRYNENGYQQGHTHSQHEDHSLIIYLNDSCSSTRIYKEGSFVDVLSEKGKIVFFDAALYHESLKCREERRVAVGAIKFVHKIWKNRQALGTVNE